MRRTERIVSLESRWRLVNASIGHILTRVPLDQQTLQSMSAVLVDNCSIMLAKMEQDPLAPQQSTDTDLSRRIPWACKSKL